MNKLYKLLMIDLNNYGYIISDNLLKQVYNDMKINNDDLLDTIANIMLKYDIKNEKLNLTSSEKIILTNKVHKLISENLKTELELESKITSKILTQATSEGFYLRNYVLALGTTVKIDKLDDDILFKIVNKTIKGKIWSKRLWSNKRIMEEDLKVLVNNFLSGKISVNKIYNEINSKYSKNAYNTKRLTHTEIARVQNEVNREFMKKQDINRVTYIATLDLKTSEICSKRDGITYSINSAPYLPAHPNCRSCYVPMVDDWKPTKRLDNISKKEIDYIDYKKWKKQNNL